MVLQQILQIKVGRSVMLNEDANKLYGLGHIRKTQTEE